MILGGRVLLTENRGRAKLEDVRKAFEFTEEIIRERFGDETEFVHVLDYRDLDGTSIRGRRHFVKAMKERKNVRALVFVGVSQLMELSVKLGSRFDVLGFEGQETDEALVVLRLPREKERLAMVLHALAASMNPDARLWVVGEKRAGINSAARLLEMRFATVRKLDSARHCSLLEARAPRECPPFSLDDYATTLRVDARPDALVLTSLPGVFAHGRLDEGTALLRDTLDTCAVAGDVLDFACGNGVLGIGLLVGHAAARLTLLDASALAIEAARRSLALNACSARVLASDGLGELDGVFDWIISNPPFHRGVDNDLDIAADQLVDGVHGTPVRYGMNGMPTGAPLRGGGNVAVGIGRGVIRRTGGICPA